MKRPAVVLLCLASAACVAWAAFSREVPVAQMDTPPLPAAPASAAATTPRATDRFPTAQGELVVSPLEHASLLFGWAGRAVYVDPTSPAIADAALPRADVIFVTEARFDHLDAVAVARLSRPGTLVVGPPRVAEKVHVDVVMKNGDTRDVLGIVVTAVPMYSVERGPAPGLLYHEKGRGNGYVLDFGGTHVYLSGDTECTPEMMQLQHIDAAFVSLSAPTAMTPAEAVRCITAFQPKVVFPYRDRRVDLSELERGLKGGSVELRERQFYPRPEKWRLDAFQACAEGHFGVCRDHLDMAKALDPAGESDPRVLRARAQVRAWQSPFPAWW
ncbi:MAG TPA: MBL fold metallo-hydrolase [Polyangiaceae bacterium]|jgi:L-ascorbate metabolism protein UlaG (beta-lactamase superfamily)